MCFSGCPYEKIGDPEHAGECTTTRPYPEDAHCFNAAEAILSEREVERGSDSDAENG